MYLDFRCRHLHLLLHCFSIAGFFVLSSASDRITTGQSIRDGETLISSGGRFAFGFFSPNNDTSTRYAGIWYNQIANRSVVWVANRESPVPANGVVLSVTTEGNLVISHNNSGQVLWSSAATSTTLPPANSTLILMNSGNLVLRAASDRVLWQSFDHPTDTYLPDMEVHISARDGEQRVFTSWSGPLDPSPGNYSMGVDTRGPPQIVIWDGPRRRWRSGHWNGLVFIGVPGMRNFYRLGFRLNERDGQLSITYTTPSSDSEMVKFRLSWEGVELQERWIEESREWEAFYRHPIDECDLYNYCGNFGMCRLGEEDRCRCLEGFESRGNRTEGCVRRAGLECETDGFLEVRRVKLPDFVDYVGSEDVRGCESLCARNCSCTAYAYVRGISCMVWYRELVDIQQYEEGENSLFVRVARSELDQVNHARRIIIITTVTVGTILICVSVWLIVKCRRKRQETLSKTKKPKVRRSGEFSYESSGPCDISIESQQSNGPELAMFSFSSVVTATDNFSDKNKLGQGGFGDVYKGMLLGGHEIAVKRLSTKSGQGLEEFKNEIMLIAKLQHRNLVRLLGCCIHGEEKLLLYEYMPNKSLDSYLFDVDKKGELDWKKRFNIIGGIARGLLYLHRDSRLRIIHRDLKASNILLDEEMNPKISDFGMARIFGGNQNEANTNRVVGTYGYMAPEYAMEGLFSLKSDVYSFGVLLLEIITGQRNIDFRLTDYVNIIGYAWNLWDKGRAVELLDLSIMKMGTSCNEQVLKCVHVAMLCVQDNAGNRPDMSAVVLMLESENMALPLPTQPTFTSTRHNIDTDMWNGIKDADQSSNNVTMSVIIGR
ncbi:G-type lectin S-receptor-like serine/threonine-protein kinase B120 [Striga hermonthica]|uniref:Receptor-like serine/threonine-protein kinase n=1 Tax=Striga hermonthica TaxID=68872 RepID=A0A9N7RMB3_STRHE|nr:G-type lectin S-receptor-like serine/threonine-protein kinase B120 [Striga hermonthica]